MTIGAFLAGLVATLICVILLYLLSDRWPVTKRLALAVAALFLIYVSAAALLGSIEDISNGRLVDAGRSGSSLVTLRAQNPIRFWFFSTLRLVGCIFLIYGGLWSLRQAVKRG